MKRFLHIVGLIGLFIGIPASIFGIYSFYYPSMAKPYFMIINDETAVTKPTSKIKIYYDSVEVPNLKIMQIAIWNDGNAYLERHKFLNPYIAEVSNKNASILQVDLEKSSRQDLKFQIKENLDKNSIYIFTGLSYKK